MHQFLAFWCTLLIYAHKFTMPYLRKRTFTRRRYTARRTFKPASFTALYRRAPVRTTRRRTLSRYRYVKPIRRINYPPIPRPAIITRQTNIPTARSFVLPRRTQQITADDRVSPVPTNAFNPLLGFRNLETPNPFIGPIRPVTKADVKSSLRRTTFRMPDRLYPPHIQRTRINLTRRLPVPKSAGKRQEDTPAIFEIDGQPLQRKTKRLKSTPHQPQRKLRGRTHLVRQKAARDTILESIHPSGGEQSRPTSPMILFDDPQLDVIQEG